MHRSAHKRYWVPRSRKDTRITFFAIQGDETKPADLDKLAQLLVFVRFVGPSSIEEEMLFWRPLETTTEADVFQVVATCFDNSGMKWEKLGHLHWQRPGNAWISKWTFCQDKPESPNTFESHCSIHCEARFSAADALPPGYFPSA